MLSVAAQCGAITMEAVIFYETSFPPLSEEAFGMVRGTLCVARDALLLGNRFFYISELAPTYALYRLAAELEDRLRRLSPARQCRGLRARKKSAPPINSSRV